MGDCRHIDAAEVEDADESAIDVKFWTALSRLGKLGIHGEFNGLMQRRGLVRLRSCCSFEA